MIEMYVLRLILKLKLYRNFLLNVPYFHDTYNLHYSLPYWPTKLFYHNITLTIFTLMRENCMWKVFRLFLASLRSLECKEIIFYDSISEEIFINILITDGVGQMPKTCEIHFLWLCVGDNIALQSAYIFVSMWMFKSKSTLFFYYVNMINISQTS